MYLALSRYSRPRTAAECLRLLAEPGERAALVAGGTDLHAREQPDLTHVVDVQALPIGDIEVDAESIRIGARVTLARLRRDERLGAPWLAALREAASAYAVVALQNRSTVGGRIASERADLDLPPALLALGARVRLLKLDGDRVIEEVIDYPTGPAREALSNALIAEVLLPRVSDGASALRRFGRSAVDVPLATCAASRAGTEVRIAANLQGPTAADLRRLTSTEALASSWNGALPDDWRRLARAAALEDAAAWGDPWASGTYRQDLTATLAVRALAACFGQPEIV